MRRWKAAISASTQWRRNHRRRVMRRKRPRGTTLAEGGDFRRTETLVIQEKMRARQVRRTLVRTRGLVTTQIRTLAMIPWSTMREKRRKRS